MPPVDKDDTYDWAKVQTVRKGTKTVNLLKATAGQPLLPITQSLDAQDMDGNPSLSTFKVDASPKWFTVTSAEVNDKHQMVVQLGTIAGKTTSTGRVVRVGSIWSGSGAPGSGQFTEYYYQISPSTQTSSTST